MWKQVLSDVIAKTLAGFEERLAAFGPSLLAMVVILAFGLAVSRHAARAPGCPAAPARLRPLRHALGLSEILARGGIKQPASATLAAVLAWGDARRLRPARDRRSEPADRHGPRVAGLLLPAPGAHRLGPSRAGRARVLVRAPQCAHRRRSTPGCPRPASWPRERAPRFSSSSRRWPSSTSAWGDRCCSRRSRSCSAGSPSPSPSPSVSEDGIWPATYSSGRCGAPRPRPRPTG